METQTFVYMIDPYQFLMFMLYSLILVIWLTEHLIPRRMVLRFDVDTNEEVEEEKKEEDDDDEETETETEVEEEETVSESKKTSDE